MNYAQIFDCDIANGPGMRVSLFVSGCTHHCEGCFNAQTWDFAYGKKYTSEITQALIQMMDRPYIKGITILGGEPMEPENQKDVLALLKAIRNAFRDSKNIWIYSGYVFEQLTGKRPCRASTLTAKEILSLADVLGRWRICNGSKRCFSCISWESQSTHTRLQSISKRRCCSMAF